MNETNDRTDQDNPQAKPARGHWREKKWIPGRNGKLYGPYWYERWRENGRCRSKYLGKA